ncbi:hypothetical protein NHP190002_11300 [Helicobacter ailurogastricus]|uniref:tetratricopeptide repeat protein n=1 Tax=Helicobacter ailurogastricus TaxID=1578720 RepID=UPI00244D8EDF|nr:tetratricopeptide repeat protein [Helicobacter ailurogastricus]GMB90437.1 hypothetical protein NHP190002_11300 [Helicobacter ailurogastricus]
MYLTIANAAFKAKNYTKAIEYFKKSCDLEDGPSCHQVGLMYWEGKGVPKNPTKTFEYYKKAVDSFIEDGFQSEVQVGYMYLLGIGTQKNYTEAKKYLQEACNRPILMGGGGYFSGEACFYLGTMYKGLGFSKNDEKATECFSKSCQYGYKESCKILAR